MMKNMVIFIFLSVCETTQCTPTAVLSIYSSRGPEMGFHNVEGLKNKRIADTKFLPWNEFS
jgi:hypothetical protein